MPSGFSTSLKDEVLLDAAVVYYEPDPSGAPDVWSPLGVFRGGASFNPNKEMRAVEFDGRRSRIEGLDRTTSFGATITGRFLQFVPAIIEPGSTSAAGSGEVVTTYTPKPASTLLVAADYLSEVRCVWRTGDATEPYKSVRFPLALMTDYGISSEDNNEGEFDVTIEAVLTETAATTSTDAAPYVLETLDALPPAS